LISLSSGVYTEKNEWCSFLNIGIEKSKKDPDPPEPSTAEEFAAELEGALHIKEQEAIIAEVPCPWLRRPDFVCARLLARRLSR
jgi:hypothetical protein